MKRVSRTLFLIILAFVVWYAPLPAKKELREARPAMRTACPYYSLDNR